MILFAWTVWIVSCVDNVDLKAAALTLYIFHLEGCVVFITQANFQQCHWYYDVKSGKDGMVMVLLKIS